MIVFKERDYKTYDLEAESSKEVCKFLKLKLKFCAFLTFLEIIDEICARIRFLMQVTKGA